MKEMTNDEWRMKTAAGCAAANHRVIRTQDHSAFCILHSAFP